MPDFTRDELAVLMPQLVADWSIRITGDKPLPAAKQTAINQKLALLWTRFLQENQEEWTSLGLTWQSHYLTTTQFHK